MEMLNHNKNNEEALILILKSFSLLFTLIKKDTSKRGELTGFSFLLISSSIHENIDLLCCQESQNFLKKSTHLPNVNFLLFPSRLEAIKIAVQHIEEAITILNNSKSLDEYLFLKAQIQQLFLFNFIDNFNERKQEHNNNANKFDLEEVFLTITNHFTNIIQTLDTATQTPHSSGIDTEIIIFKTENFNLYFEFLNKMIYKNILINVNHVDTRISYPLLSQLLTNETNNKISYFIMESKKLIHLIHSLYFNESDVLSVSIDLILVLYIFGIYDAGQTSELAQDTTSGYAVQHASRLMDLLYCKLRCDKSPDLVSSCYDMGDAFYNIAATFRLFLVDASIVDSQVIARYETELEKVIEHATVVFPGQGTESRSTIPSRFDHRLLLEFAVLLYERSLIHCDAADCAEGQVERDTKGDLHYNLCCCHWLLGEEEAAHQSLLRCIECSAAGRVGVLADAVADPDLHRIEQQQWFLELQTDPR